MLLLTREAVQSAMLTPCGGTIYTNCWQTLSLFILIDTEKCVSIEQGQDATKIHLV